MEDRIEKVVRTNAYAEYPWSVLVKVRPEAVSRTLGEDGGELPPELQELEALLTDRHGEVRFQRRITSLTTDQIRGLSTRAVSVYSEQLEAQRQLAATTQNSLLAEMLNHQPEAPQRSDTPDLLRYYVIEAGDRERADAIQKSLNTREDLVELSVLQGPPAPQPAIPDVNLQQGYLDSPNEHPAEVMLLSYTGINVRPLWGHPGGRGEHVKIGVIENRWEESNYDINWAEQTGEAEWNCPPVISQDDEEGELRHAISDLGILIAQDNGEGVIGIANGAQVRLASRFRCAHSQAQANALADAIVTLLNDELSFGDILLIEQQIERKVTEHSGNTLYRLPVEVEPDIWEAIRLATDCGVTVIEPAGNGAFNGAWFSATLNSANTNDSGAIVVGASEARSPHRKLQMSLFSNVGTRVNCFAWGELVTTLDLNNATWEDYNGTSSASAIIAGVAAVLQSMFRERAGAFLFPSQVRIALSDQSRGVTSQDQIGVMPDLNQIVEDLTR